MIIALQVVVVVMAEALLTAMSVMTASRFPGHPRLPMQWQFDGAVSSTAPRGFALAFTPVLSAFVLSIVLALSILTDVRPGEDWLLLLVTILVASGMVGAHAFHLWLMRRTLRG